MGMGTATETKTKSSGGVLRSTVLGVASVCFAVPALAGEWTITPTIAVTETASDNIFTSSTQAESALVSDITPGISINGSGSRAKLRLSYQMHNLIYSLNPSENNRTQNALSAAGSLEALENWLFIDATGIISQQSISAFGAAPVSPGVSTSVSKNITETSAYGVSPYIRGAFGSFADYQLRYTLNTSRSKASSIFDTDTATWLGNLSGKTPLAAIGWSINGSASEIDYSNARTKKDNRLRGIVYYQFNPQFRVSLIGGREENNYQSLEMESSTISGAGFTWSPTERTLVDFSREDRFFGPANTFTFSHRTALTAWRASASEDASSQATQQSQNIGTNFDLLDTIFSSAIPDPVQRAAFVNAFLLANGLSPDTVLQSGFLTSSTVLRQLRQISFALIGARNTVTFSATQNNSQSLSLVTGTGVMVGSQQSANDVDQLGGSVSWSHRLTPMSSLIGTVSYLNSTGTGTNRLETTQKYFSVNFVTQLGPKTNAGVSVRRVVADGTADYTENALVATLAHQF